LRTYDNKFLLFLVGITLLRLVVISNLGLHPDEAYYWLWSRFPDFGYYDHPPMFAYFIRLATMFGDSPFFVRLPAIISGIIITIAVYKTAKILFPHSSSIPFLSAVILNVMPLISSGIIMTPDAPSLLFWSLAVWLLAVLFIGSPPKEEKVANNPSVSSRYILNIWLAIGLLAGLGMLSKYTSVLLFLCMFIYVIISGKNRRWLFTQYPYLAGIVALFVFSPVIIWNAHHNWASFAFQLKHGVGGQSLTFVNFLNYLGAQIAAGGVFPMIIGGIGSVFFLFSKDESRKFLSSITLPVFVFFGITSFRTTAEANWTAPAYIGLSLINGAIISVGDKNTPRLFFNALKKISAVLTIALPFLMTLILYLQVAFRMIPFDKINPLWHLMEPTNRFYGWEEFTQHLMEISDGRPVIAPDHQSASLILYYSRHKPIEVRAGTNNFIFYEKFTKPVKGRCFTFDYTTDVKTGPVDFSLFSSIKEKDDFKALRDGVPIRSYRIYECQDFAGFNRR